MNTRFLLFFFLLLAVLVAADDSGSFKEEQKLWKEKLIEQTKVDPEDRHEGKNKHGHFRGDLLADGIENATGIHKSHGTLDAWLHGIIHSTVMIIATEFFDKTFFITAILSMSQNKWAVWSASIAALFLMTGLSCFLGLLLPALIPREVTIYVASALFIVFGVKMIIESKNMTEGNSEYDDAKNELSKKSGVGHLSDSERAPLVNLSENAHLSDVEAPEQPKKKSTRMSFKSVFIEVFIMIFFAEWGDRSQVSSILLASTNPILSVFIGGCLGHFICTTIATICGQLLAIKVSPRIVTFLGGVLFLVFSVTIHLAE